ncbi:hypothetical protein [Sporosarcina sp. FSL K6-2383]|uniref:hypothetical protein n=1 Tax=Sporosarcina sp. FSL K6-2383 TaxID=2921556 RepID=UPI00315AC3F2
MKEVFHEIYGLTGLVTDGHFVALNEWKHPQHRFFKNADHDPAAGDYEPIQRDKQITLMEVKQRAEILVPMRDMRKKADETLQ